MALLGSIIKKGFELNQKLAQDSESPAEQQQKQLKNLISRAKDTAFGKYYGFAELLKRPDFQDAFRARIPIYDYHKLYDDWWRQQQLFPDITWPGKPRFFALSSGTTGKSSKRIPITEDFIQSMRQVGLSMMRALPDFDFDEELYESEVLMLSSSAHLVKHEQGHLEGEISGINVSNFPGWYEFFYRPGKEIASMDDWDERVNAIARAAPQWDIGAIAGIPSWILPMIKKVMEVNQLNTIHDIWPNLRVFASGGVAFETYRKDFEKVTARPLIIMDTFLASEGFFAYTARPETMAMRLALSHGYFYEFIPFDERGVDDMGNILEKPESFLIHEVELEQEYVLVISTCAGAWRYVIGDVIRFTSLEPHEIVITGRTKFYMNVVGSQLSEEKLDAAILEVSEDLNITVNEYSLAAVRPDGEDYIHQWVVVTEAEKVDEEEFREKLDAALKDANKNYAVARGKALKDIRVRVIAKQDYYSYMQKGEHLGGQAKTPKVMPEEKMKDLLKFLDSLE